MKHIGIEKNTFEWGDSPSLITIMFKKFIKCMDEGHMPSFVGEGK